MTGRVNLLTPDAATAELLAEGNARLLAGDNATALRSYFRFLAAMPEMADSIAFNLVLARRRYRRDRAGMASDIAVVLADPHADATAAARDAHPSARLITIGPGISVGSGHQADIRAGQPLDLPLRALAFVLATPMDVVHLAAPSAATALTGLLYRLVWGAQVICVPGEAAAGAGSKTQDTNALAYRLPANWPDMIRGDTDYSRLFPHGEASAVLPAKLLDGPQADAFARMGGLAACIAPSRARPGEDGTADCPYLVDVIVAVHNALDDVQACIASLLQAATTTRQRIIIVNDGSEIDTTLWLREIAVAPCPDYLIFDLVEHPNNRGYTCAVNTGLRRSSAPFVVTLNSDTIVTDGWVEGLLSCINSAPDIGICGPLSNAASWQNVPELYAADKSFAVNALPPDLSADDMAVVVRRSSLRTRPRTAFVNGFCYMIRREVIDAIGLMDEAAFPVGYGEENDFSIRAQDAGFVLAIADDTYVFHLKSKSFGDDRRKQLSRAGNVAIREKHGSARFDSLVDQVKDTTAMDAVRDRINCLLASGPSTRASLVWERFMAQKVLFVLPVRGGSGGVHSVLQEALAMHRMGIVARIAVEMRHLSNFRILYRDVPEAEEIFHGFGPGELDRLAVDFDVVVATIYNSVAQVAAICARFPWIQPAYYIQDYEPNFSLPDTDAWRLARDSYTRLPGAVCFAKTAWLCHEVERRHGIRVAKVRPSIDHDVYGPAPGPRAPDRTVHLTAMIRPSTPRRAAGRTMTLLARLSRAHGDAVRITVFGCDPADPAYLALDRDFPHNNLGGLDRTGVAALLRQSDLFIDMSDYQAFGRTALEAMACGSLALVPLIGGADEYARNGENAIIADTFDITACQTAIEALIADRPRLDRMRLAAVETANAYSARRAAVSLLGVLGPAVAARRRCYAAPGRLRVALLPQLVAAELPSRIGLSRLIATFGQDALIDRVRAQPILTRNLPDPDGVDVAVVQDGCILNRSQELVSWLDAVKAAGGRVIADLDQRTLADASPDTIKWKRQLIACSDSVMVPALGADLPAGAFVMPDLLDARIWARAVAALDQLTLEPGTTEGPVRIGIFISPEQEADLAPLAPAMQAVAAECGDRVAIEVIGAFEKTKTLFGKRVGWPRQRDYRCFADWLPQVAGWDILVLPPCGNQPSTERLHFLEATVLGAAIVCQHAAATEGCAIDDETCLVVDGSVASWSEAIRRLTRDATLRGRLASTAGQRTTSAFCVGGSEDPTAVILRTHGMGAAKR
jgi:GT2 family glycosyltransferase